MRAESGDGMGEGHGPRGPWRLKLAAVPAACLLLGACGIGGWFGEAEEPPLPGTRISVLELSAGLEPDPAAAGRPFALPDAVANANWAQAGGAPSHSGGNFAGGGSLSEVWTADIGAGATRNRRLLTVPIVAEGRLYALDTVGNLTALDAATGRQLWRVRVASPREDSVPLGGGVSFADGLVYVGTGFGEVLAIDPANGGLVWRTETSGPIRSAPTVDAGRVFVVTVDNQLTALDAPTGALLWTHTGILENAGLLGGASPATEAGVVIAPYSSGEVFALRVENGRPVWSDSLVAVRRAGALAGLADIRGEPVISDTLAIVTSHSGRTAAIDMRTGARAWEQSIGGIDMPWVAGDTVFLLTNDQQLVAMVRDSGAIRWVTPLPRWERPDRRDGPIVWSGPVMAGGRLVLVNSDRDLIAVSPESGAAAGQARLRAGATVPPIVAGGMIYVLTEDGAVTAYR